MSEIVENQSDVMSHPFVNQMIVQLRAVDSYGTYDNWSDEKVIDPLILTKERKREIPVVGDPDETVISRFRSLVRIRGSITFSSDQLS